MSIQVRDNIGLVFSILNIIIDITDRCGQETRVIPRILQLRAHWLKSERENVRLEEAGITKEVSIDVSDLHKTTNHRFCIDNIHAGDEQCDCAVLPGSDCSAQRTGSAFVQQGSADAETRLVRD